MVDDAQVFDLGFARYDEQRTSRRARNWAIIVDGIRQVLGLGRGTGAKFVSWSLIAFAVLPALALVVIAAAVKSIGLDQAGIQIPSYPDYFDLASAPIALLVALVAPRLITTDRRDGVLPLYAVRPITVGEYVAARWIALTGVIFVMLIVAEGALYSWNLFAADNPLTWLGDNMLLAPRIIAASFVSALLLATIALVVSTFTRRPMYAAVATLMVMFVATSLAGMSGELLGEGLLRSLMQLIGVFQVRSDVVRWIFGHPVFGAPHGAVQLVWVLVACAAMGYVALVRVRRLVRQ